MRPLRCERRPGRLGYAKRSNRWREVGAGNWGPCLAHRPGSGTGGRGRGIEKGSSEVKAITPSGYKHFHVSSFEPETDRLKAASAVLAGSGTALDRSVAAALGPLSIAAARHQDEFTHWLQIRSAPLARLGGAQFRFDIPAGKSPVPGPLIASSPRPRRASSHRPRRSSLPPGTRGRSPAVPSATCRTAPPPPNLSASASVRREARRRLRRWWSRCGRSGTA